MTVDHPAAATLDPALLVRHVQGELDDDERAAIDAHLARCDRCRALAASLSKRMRRISDALDASDFPQPEAREWSAVRDAVKAAGSATPRAHASPRFGRRGSLLPIAAAAVLAVGATAVLAAPPLRTWIVERWESVTGRAPAAVVATDAEGEASVAFRPEGAKVDVAFDAAQAGGALHVRFTGDDAAIIAVSEGGAERFAVGSRGVRIANDARASASYRVTLPARVESVSIRIGAGEPILIARRDALEAEIDLATGRARLHR